jgi:hypothetical protein
MLGAASNSAGQLRQPCSGTSRATALDHCRAIGLHRILLCCSPDNEASRRVIVTNGGRPDGHRHGENRYWIEIEGRRSSHADTTIREGEGRFG